MATTHTTNFNLTKPSVGGDSNAWGQMLNDDLDTIDGQMHTNAEAVANLHQVARSGSYNDLINKPSLGSAAAKNTADFATAAQGATADAAMPKAGGTFTGNIDVTKSGPVHFSLVSTDSAIDVQVNLQNAVRSTRVTNTSTGDVGFYDVGASRWILKISNATDNASFRGTVTAPDHINSSDVRLKKDIADYDAAPLWSFWPRLVSYHWKSTGEPDLGVIAQEVQQNFPELVHKDAEGMLGVAYDKLAIVLLNAMRDQVLQLQKRVDELERAL